MPYSMCEPPARRFAFGVWRFVLVLVLESRFLRTGLRKSFVPEELNDVSQVSRGCGTRYPEKIRPVPIGSGPDWSDRDEQLLVPTAV